MERAASRFLQSGGSLSDKTACCQDVEVFQKLGKGSGTAAGNWPALGTTPARYRYYRSPRTGHPLAELDFGDVPWPDSDLPHFAAPTGPPQSVRDGATVGGTAALVASGSAADRAAVARTPRSQNSEVDA
jgi:hypothetical protein